MNQARGHCGRAWALAACIEATVGLVACGGGGSDTAPPAPTPAPAPSPAPGPTPAPTPAPTPTPSPSTPLPEVLQLAGDDGEVGMPTQWRVGLATTAGLSFGWDFGDGTQADNESPSHTYLAAGSYTVTLTVRNAAGEQRMARTTQVINRTQGLRELACTNGAGRGWCRSVTPGGLSVESMAPGGLQGWGIEYPSFSYSYNFQPPGITALLKTSDGGRQWTVAAHPVASAQWTNVQARGNGLVDLWNADDMRWRSTDGGANWTTMPQFRWPVRSRVTGVRGLPQFLPSGHLVVAFTYEYEPTEWHVSADDGQSWIGPLASASLVGTPGGALLRLAVDRKSIQSSRDGGRSWVAAPLLPAPEYLDSLRPAGNGAVLALGYRGNRPYVASTLDGGVNWRVSDTSAWPSLQSIPTMYSQTMDASQPWLVQWWLGLYASADQGLSWRKLREPAAESIGGRWNARALSSDVLLFQFGNALEQSTDGGTTWQRIQKGGALANGWVHEGDGVVRRRAPPGSSALAQRSAYLGRAWGAVLSESEAASALRECLSTASSAVTEGRPVTLGPCLIDPGLLSEDVQRHIGWLRAGESGWGWVLLGNSIFRTTDGGANWQRSAQDFYGDRGFLNRLFVLDAQHAWVQAQNRSGLGVLLRTQSGGAAWEEMQTRTVGQVLAMFDARRGLAAYCGLGQGSFMCRTEDGGRTWSDAATPAGVQFLAGAWQTAAQTVWLQSSAGKLFRSDDGGLRWSEGGSLPIDCRDQVPSLRDIRFAATARIGWAVADCGYVAKTMDGGASWTLQRSGVWTDLRTIRLRDERTLEVFGPNGELLMTGTGGE